LKNWLPLGESKSRLRMRCAMMRMLPLRELICVVSYLFARTTSFPLNRLSEKP